MKLNEYFLGLGIGFVLGCMLSAIVMGNWYKEGQIDAINGKIKYELVTQSNGSTEWEKIDDADKD